MPEADAVRRTARRLARALDGRVLTRTDLRVPQHATADLSGATVLETVSRGKHLLTRIDAADQRVTLHTHLKMEGSWRVFEAGKRWNPHSHEIRVVLGTDGPTAVGYLLGIVELLPTDREPDVVGHLGPDPLGPDWDEQEALRRLREHAGEPVFEALRDQTSLAGARTGISIGEALLDQRNLAGLGTVYVAETLFLAGVCPLTPVADTPDPVKVVRIARKLLVANVDRPMRVTTGVARRGEDLWVYGRAGRPCRRCGTPVSSGALGIPPYERVTFWCPSCQPGMALPSLDPS